MAILADLNDPRIANVTLIRVEVSGDLREAKVYVSVMGEEKEQRLCMHGLRSAAGYLQSKVDNRIDTRYTPRIEFVLDQGVKRSIEIHRILDDVLPATEAASETISTDTDSAQEDDVTQSDEPRR